MAIIDSLPGVEVAIQVDGRPLREYIDSEIEDQERTISRYVAAKSDQEFMVEVKVSKGTKIRGNILCVEVHINGTYGDTAAIHKKRFSAEDCTTHIQGKTVGKELLRKFRFSVLETASDGRAFHGEREKLRSIGIVSVKIHFKTFVKVIKSKTYTDPKEINIVSEKAVKGESFTHSIGLSEAIPAPHRETWDTLYCDSPKNPAATFNFHCRSLDMLKAMLIIPRTPTPPPLGQRDFNTLTSEELRELHQRARASLEAEAHRGKVKRERSDDNPRPKKIARPYAGDVVLELDEDGEFREASTEDLEARERVTVDLE